MLQNMLIAKDTSTYKVLTDLTRDVVFETDQAHKAVRYAVDALQGEGGEIMLGRGDFVLDAPLRLADKVWLRGSGRGTKLLVSGENQAGVGILCEELKGVEISNLAVTAGKNDNAVAGVVLDGCGDSKVHDVFGVGFSHYGIWVRNHSFLCAVSRCSLAGNRKANLFFDTHRRGKVGDFIPNLITNCMIYGGGKGIDCLETTVLNIVACAVYQTRDVAYHIRDMSYSVLVSGCRSFQIGSNAVVVENTGEFNLSSNIFCWHTGHGVVVNNCGWGVITGNEIIDSGSYNPNAPDFSTKIADVPEDVPLYDGIQLHKSRGFNVTGNTIFNWPQARKMRVGIFEDRDGRGNSITDNNINYYAEDAIIAQGQDTTVRNNTVAPEPPYDGNPNETQLQSFQSQLTTQWIESMV